MGNQTKQRRARFASLFHPDLHRRGQYQFEMYFRLISIFGEVGISKEILSLLRSYFYGKGKASLLNLES